MAFWHVLSTEKRLVKRHHFVPQPWHYSRWELKSYIDITPIYKPCVLGRQVQFWNICLSYAFHFQSVPNMCLNDWWSHMVPWIKHFIVLSLGAFQQLYYRSLKIKMIQLLRGYVPQGTLQFCFSCPHLLYFLPLSVSSVCSAGGAVTLSTDGLLEESTKSDFSFPCRVHVEMLNIWHIPGSSWISWGRGERAAPVTDYFISRIKFGKGVTVHEQVMTGGRSENYGPQILKALF